jgi:hypothetical protein
MKRERQRVNAVAREPDDLCRPGGIHLSQEEARFRDNGFTAAKWRDARGEDSNGPVVLGIVLG